MSVATQISGNIRPNNETIHSLIHMLNHIGIDVTQPLGDESFFYEINTDNAWQHYNSEIDFYESIAHSKFHIVNSDQPVSDEIGMQILYAMIKRRPIVVSGKLIFEDSLHPFMKGLIVRNTPLFHSVDLHELELTELSPLLGRLKPIDYKLHNSQKMLINTTIRKHLSNLLDGAKGSLAVA